MIAQHGIHFLKMKNWLGPSLKIKEAGIKY